MAELFKYVRHLLKYEAGISEDFEYPEKEKQILEPLFENYRSFLIFYRVGVPVPECVKKTHDLIDYAIKKSVSNHKNDPGGLTVCGITKKTWETACREGLFNVFPQVDFVNMTSRHWLSVVRTYYWDVWKADDLYSQELAEQVIDFYFHSDASATKKIQRLLHVEPDGVIGPKTLKALSHADQNFPRILCSQIKRERLAYLLVLSRKEKYSAFAYGWLRRIVDW